MTDEMERRAEEIFAHLLDLGDGSILEGTYVGIENGYYVGEIAEAAYRFERNVNAGRRIVVGVNEFTDGDDRTKAELLRIEGDVEDYQLKRLQHVKEERDSAAVDRALAALVADAEDPTLNTMPAMIEAVRAMATEGEIVASLEGVFGTYVERAVI